MSNSRKNIRELVNKIESDYSVAEWKHNGYHIWPVLRIALYMFLKGRESGENKKNVAKKQVRLYQVWQAIKSIKTLIFIDKKISSLYIGAPSHCVKYMDKEFNRYFDPLMDANNNSSLYLSKSKSTKGVYKPYRHLSYTNLLFGYRILNKLFGAYANGSPHVKEICAIIERLGYSIVGFEKKVDSFLKTVDVSYALGFTLLNNIRPKELWVLCYYSADVMGLLIAAHKLGIFTIDMQHGGQGKNHLAYNSWKKIPAEGYEALPNIFYTWDKASAHNINKWAGKTEKHKAKKFGNPWVEGWKTGEFSESEYNWPKNLVLYTLQPVEEPLESYLLKVIATTKGKYNWWLRLHPRQLSEIEDLKLRLREFNLLEDVNIDDATKLPLPEILTHTTVHLTKFSGCAIEAFQFGVPTILIDKKGEDIYSEYVKSSELMHSFLEENSNGLVSEIRNFFTNLD